METESLKNYEMHKRCELMADGRRYIIYYTFGESAVELPEPSSAEMSLSIETETEKTEIK